jgi:hypothetical protein
MGKSKRAMDLSSSHASQGWASSLIFSLLTAEKSSLVTGSSATANHFKTVKSRLKPFAQHAQGGSPHAIRGRVARIDCGHHQLPKASADCARVNICLLNSANSSTSSSASCPAHVAVSISVRNTTAVATSALHAKHSFSVRPGSSHSSVVRPHMLQVPVNSI